MAHVWLLGFSLPKFRSKISVVTRSQSSNLRALFLYRALVPSSALSPHSSSSQIGGAMDSLPWTRVAVVGVGTAIASFTGPCFSLERAL